MKFLLMLLATVLLSCNETITTPTNSTTTDSIKDKPNPDNEAEAIKPPSPSAQPKEYSNARFKEVTITKSGENEYTIKGKGQIFEANFSYVVEDGHEELKKGHQMTDAGAPDWGNFKFTIDVPKKRPNSTLTLILFEISAEDGRRVHELPISLPDK